MHRACLLASKAALGKPVPITTMIREAPPMTTMTPTFTRRKSARAAALAALALVLAAVPAQAADTTVAASTPAAEKAPDPAVAAAVMQTVHHYVDSLNRGDNAGVIASCAREAAIVDEFAPYEWHGADTCAHWLAALTAHNAAIGLTKGVNTLRKPRRVDVTGDRAYVVVPADFRYTLGGQQGAEVDATFTVALHKEAAGWRITGWAWSRPEFDLDY